MWVSFNFLLLMLFCCSFESYSYWALCYWLRKQSCPGQIMGSSACNHIHGTCIHLAISDMYYVPPHPLCAMAEAFKSLACHQGGLASIPDQYMWDTQRMKWHWDRFSFDEDFGFSLPVSFHQYCKIIHLPLKLYTVESRSIVFEGDGENKRWMRKNDQSKYVVLSSSKVS